MDSYKSAMDKANANGKAVEDIASRYEELSKGVGNFGENIALTTGWHCLHWYNPVPFVETFQQSG